MGHLRLYREAFGMSLQIHFLILFLMGILAGVLGEDTFVQQMFLRGSSEVLVRGDVCI